MVGLDQEGRIAFGLRPVDQRPLARPLPEGAVVETSPVANAIMGTLAGRIATDGGAMLAIDYGSDRPGHGDTLQAVKAHKYTDPLAEPGEADLTAHVDFANLARAATAAGAKAYPLLGQGEFLKRLGIGPRAEALAEGKDDATREQVRAALERLTGTAAMGDLFKVLAVGKPGLLMPAFDGHTA
jgi:NADH dehydrogenase [ubiquinone] 1 alpha subcomplex assembly factor 7